MVSWSELNDSLESAGDTSSGVPVIDYFRFRIPPLRLPTGLMAALPKTRSAIPERSARRVPDLRWR